MKVGLLVGRERSFPEVFINYVNSSKLGFTAEMVKVGGVNADEGKQYDLIIDRISHEIPFYRSYLKTAALNGTIIINNPFWWSADDKFFGTALVEKLGVAIPKTVLLPQKAYQEDVSDESLRNLLYPIQWQEILEYTGLPAIMKPYDGGGWRHVYKINSMDELLYYYDHTGTICMMLQEFITFDRYVRCYTIGRKHVRIMPYDPSKAYLQNQYFIDEGYLDKALHDRIVSDCLKLNEALGYDINTAEFAIRDGIPYAIDFTNPAPDADKRSVGEENQQWLVETVAELCADYLKGNAKKPAPLRWSDFLNPPLASARK
jgi:hypothetical protein